jgi:hypothetical protein
LLKCHKGAKKAMKKAAGGGSWPGFVAADLLKIDH